MAYKWQIVNSEPNQTKPKQLTKQLSSMENSFRSLDGILIRPGVFLYAHIYNNLQVNLLHTVIYPILTCWQHGL